MSRSRFVYTVLTTANFQAHFPPRKPTRRIGETDELGIDNGTPLFAGLFGRAGHDLPDAPRGGPERKFGARGDRSVAG